MVLVGILLVGFSSRGHSLVFHYPPSTNHQQQQSTEDNTKSSLSLFNAVVSSPLTTDQQPGSNNDEPSANPNNSKRETFLGFDTQILSDLLSPKSALCDRKFNTCVDDIHFLGHPTLLNADRQGADHQYARDIQKRRDAAKKSSKADDVLGLPAINLKEVIGSPIRSNSSPTRSTALSNSIHSEHDTPTMKSSPPRSPPSSIQNSIDVPTPTTEATIEMPVLNSPISPTTAITSKPPLTMFNLVFAFRAESNKPINKEIDGIYKTVLSKITSALKYEQLKRFYIRKEVEIISKYKESQVPEIHAGKMTYEQMMLNILDKSSLAKTLAHVYHSIKNKSMAHLSINFSVDFSFQTVSPMSNQNPIEASTSVSTVSIAKSSSILDVSSTGAAGPGEENLEFPVFFPNKGLLLLKDPEDIVLGLPADPSPLLVSLIQEVTPTLSFEGLQKSLDCSLSQIYRLSAHLVNWKQAKVIEVISIKNVYVVSPSANLSQLKALSKSFNAQFPEMDLINILSELKIPKPYSSILPNKESKETYLEILTFLLCNDLVFQMNMYLYLLIPESIRKTVRESHGQKIPSKSSQTLFQDDDPYIMTNPKSPSDIEQEYLVCIATLNPPPLSEMFLKLAPYFSGKHHIGEICYRERISKKDLRMILGRYRDQIITCLR